MSLHVDPPGSVPHLLARSRLDLLVQLTQIPTAAGREDRVIEFVRAWAAARPSIGLTADAAGNLTLALTARKKTRRSKPEAPARPLYITAHLDHPAFVVEAIDPAARTIELSFRGGVQAVFFEHAPITLYARGGPYSATLTSLAPAPRASSPAGTHYLAELDEDAHARLPHVRVGDIATWSIPGSEIDANGLLHAPACDDLAAAAAALSALDELRLRREAGEAIGDVRVLLTRSEEIGFIGAIAACRLGTMPKGSRVLALENSRAFADSPIGGGPIVRVGDRLTIFTPWLTGACAQRAEEVFGGPSSPTAAQLASQAASRPWQRKLMSGGACEASVYCHAGYDATCICLPLGNYHNMPHLDQLQAGRYDSTVLGPPRCEREFIHTEDYLSMIDLLVALAIKLPEPDAAALGERLDKMYAERAYVLGAVSGRAKKPSVRAAPKKKARRKSVARRTAKTRRPSRAAGRPRPKKPGRSR